MCGEDLGDHRPCDRQRRELCARATSRVLQPAVRQGRQHHVAMPADKRAPLEVIEPQLVLQFFVLLLDRPSVMRQAHQRSQRRGRRQRDQIRFARGVVPRSRSKSSQTSGASRCVRQSWAGVTRSAAKCAARGRLEPLRHVTRRHARAGSPAAMARTASGHASSVSCGRVGGRDRPGLRRGTATVGVPRKTLSVDEMPSLAVGETHE